MQVVEHIERSTRSWGERLKRASLIALGLALLALGASYVLMLVVVTPSGIVLYPEMYTSPCNLFDRTRNVALLAGVIYLGLNIMSTPKRPVLFLRRFGLDVNSVVSRVIRAGLGRRFRFVTLDDGRFPPLDIPAFERWGSRLGPPIVAAIVTAGALAVRAEYSHKGDSGGYYATATGVMAAVTGYWIGMFWVLVVLAWAHSLKVRWRSRFRIQTEYQLSAFHAYVRRLGLWRFRLTLLQPQAVIAKVSDALWQRSIAAISDELGLVLIDISDPTSNLHWEIERARKAGIQCVFIAEQASLRAWLEYGPEAPDSSLRADIIKFVGEDLVLTYHGHESLGGARFRRSMAELLRAAIKSSPKRRSSARFEIFDRIWWASVRVAYHGSILAVALLSGTLIGFFTFLAV